MFVIVQCYYNLSPEDQKKDMAERMGLTMRHAGVAITVTSLTDVFAFGIGAVTVRFQKCFLRSNVVVTVDNEIPVSKQPRSESISRLRRVQIFEKKILSPLFHALNGP